MNKGYKGNNGISKAQVIELIVVEVAKIQTGGLDLSTYAKKSEVSTQISNAIKKFLTEEEVQALLEALDIPTKTSELQNDLNLVNKTYVDNAVNAKKHYTEEEIKTIIEGVLAEKEISGTVDEEAVQTIINESLSQLNIPTKTSQLINDSNFITGSEVDTKIANVGLGGGRVDKEELVVLSAINGEASMTLSSLHSIVITENTTINLPTIEKDYWEAKLYIKGQKGNVVTLKEGDIADEIELGCDKQHVLKIVKINGEFNAELIDYSPEDSTEENEVGLKEVSVVDNNLQLLDCPIQICKNLVDNTTILLPNLTEEYKEIRLIFNNSGNITLNLTSEETSSPMVISQIGVIEIAFKKILGSWNVSKKAYNSGINIAGE